MNKSTCLAVTVLAAALCGPAFAQDKNAPDVKVARTATPGQASVVGTAKMTATVEAIDVATRHVTLKGPKGNTMTLAVGPEVKNLDKVKVGDRVVARYVEALTLTLKKDGKELPGKKESADAVRAQAGEPAGAGVARRVEITADVTAVNAKKHIVTLKGPERVLELYVEDLEQLKLIKVGDQIQAVYTEALALGVEPVRK
jgi:Cu/Ag efflux protein CusF